MNAAFGALLPDVTEPLMAPFWAASRRHVLVVQQCGQCGQRRFPPLPLCSNCWSEDQSWVEVAGEGSLWSFVIYRRALSKAFADDVPYAVGRVKVDAGPIFTVRLDIPFDDLEVDMRVRATFKEVTHEVTLLQFVKGE